MRVLSRLSCKLKSKCKLKELKLSDVADVVDFPALDYAVGSYAPLSVESQFPVDSLSVFDPDLDF